MEDKTTKGILLIGFENILAVVAIFAAISGFFTGLVLSAWFHFFWN